MRTLPNTQLSDYFTRYEVIEGKALPQKAVEMNWANIAQYNEDAYVRLCRFLDGVRRDINNEFGKHIGLRVNAGFRCRQWELAQGRSGNSQHTVGAAIDIYPTNCTKQVANIILDWIYTKYNPTYVGGLAISPNSFVHFDNRGTKARWIY